MASTAASKAKKRAPVGRKAEARKKRKLEGAENQPPHQKIQTSMLSFQAPKAKDADKENVAQAQVEVKQEVKEEADNQTEQVQVQVKQEAQREETPETQEPEQTAPPPPPPVPQRDEYAPRPYKFTFDHRSSCFDEETYAASVRDIDAPSATLSSHHAKLVRELDIYYRKHETKYLPEADYIGTVQLDINEKMRTILVDWLVEVGEEFKPSKLVASAVYLARLMTGEAEAWTPTLHHVTQYNPLEIQDCVEELCRLHTIEAQVVSTQRDKAKAVSEKYLADKFHAASTIPACGKNKLAESFSHYASS
ncbi:unnamed protein product [Phytophthora lilii]|uniref:Unnamed protein product n=1 Tax=Phytophthora lilii TaxID=2077276 RepID=A0A9W6WY87_9STRA|nr:unnamed protein product [Phytophthora lilii]